MLAASIKMGQYILSQARWNGEYPRRFEDSLYLSYGILWTWIFFYKITNYVVLFNGVHRYQVLYRLPPPALANFLIMCVFLMILYLWPGEFRCLAPLPAWKCRARRQGSARLVLLCDSHTFIWRIISIIQLSYWGFVNVRHRNSLSSNCNIRGPLFHIFLF